MLKTKACDMEHLQRSTLHWNSIFFNRSRGEKMYHTRLPAHLLKPEGSPMCLPSPCQAPQPVPQQQLPPWACFPRQEAHCGPQGPETYNTTSSKRLERLWRRLCPSPSIYGSCTVATQRSWLIREGEKKKNHTVIFRGRFKKNNFPPRIAIFSIFFMVVQTATMGHDVRHQFSSNSPVSNLQRCQKSKKSWAGLNEQLLFILYIFLFSYGTIA